MRGQDEIISRPHREGLNSPDRDHHKKYPLMSGKYTVSTGRIGEVYIPT